MYKPFDQNGNEDNTCYVVAVMDMKKSGNMFSRQAIPMVWDYFEPNLLSGSFSRNLGEHVPTDTCGH